MNKRLAIILIYALPLPVLAVSLFIGPSTQVGPADLLKYANGEAVVVQARIIEAIFFNVRLPRILLVFLVGGVLAMSGSTLQAVFRNPLVSPYVLGLSSGAAFGAALALATNYLPVSLSAFVFGLSAISLSYFVARQRKTLSVVSLILAGIVVNGIFTALLTIVQFISDPFKLQSIVLWTMGNFQNANWEKLLAALGPAALGVTVLLILRWRLNVLALGDDEARSVGIDPARNKSVALLLVSLASSAAVATAGIISLYGLMIPHIVRMIAGVDNRVTLPLNFLFGGMFLLLIDNVSRSLTDFEIPIGIFTMLLGAPFFIYLMKKNNVGWRQ
jgi:iron complex transport system permease protein